MSTVADLPYPIALAAPGLSAPTEKARAASCAAIHRTLATFALALHLDSESETPDLDDFLRSKFLVEPANPAVWLDLLDAALRPFRKKPGRLPELVRFWKSGDLEKTIDLAALDFLSKWQLVVPLAVEPRGKDVEVREALVLRVAPVVQSLKVLVRGPVEVGEEVLLVREGETLRLSPLVVWFEEDLWFLEATSRAPWDPRHARGLVYAGTSGELVLDREVGARWLRIFDERLGRWLVPAPGLHERPFTETPVRTTGKTPPVTDDVRKPLAWIAAAPRGLETRDLARLLGVPTPWHAATTVRSLLPYLVQRRKGRLTLRDDVRLPPATVREAHAALAALDLSSKPLHLRESGRGREAAALLEGPWAEDLAANEGAAAARDELVLAAKGAEDPIRAARLALVASLVDRGPAVLGDRILAALARHGDPRAAGELARKVGPLVLAPVAREAGARAPRLGARLASGLEGKARDETLVAIAQAAGSLPLAREVMEGVRDPELRASFFEALAGEAPRPRPADAFFDRATSEAPRPKVGFSDLATLDADGDAPDAETVRYRGKRRERWERTASIEALTGGKGTTESRPEAQARELAAAALEAPSGSARALVLRATSLALNASQRELRVRALAAASSGLASAVDAKVAGGKKLEGKELDAARAMLVSSSELARNAIAEAVLEADAAARADLLVVATSALAGTDPDAAERTADLLPRGRDRVRVLAAAFALDRARDEATALGVSVPEAPADLVPEAASSAAWIAALVGDPVATFPAFVNALARAWGETFPRAVRKALEAIEAAERQAARILAVGLTPEWTSGKPPALPSDAGRIATDPWVYAPATRELALLDRKLAAGRATAQDLDRLVALREARGETSLVEKARAAFATQAPLPPPPAPSPSFDELVLEEEGSVVARVGLDKDEIIIGRKGDLVLASLDVSRHHAFVRRRPEGWVVFDTGSRNGTRVNGELVPDTGRLLREGDAIGIASFTIRCSRSRPGEPRTRSFQRTKIPLRSSASLAALRDELVVERDEKEIDRFPLREGILVIGRRGDVVLESLNVSRQHAIVRKKPGESYRIFDNGSRNGTLVDGHSVPSEGTALEDGATIEIGEFVLRVVLGAKDRASTSSAPPPDLIGRETEKEKPRVAPLSSKEEPEKTKLALANVAPEMRALLASVPKERPDRKPVPLSLMPHALTSGVWSERRFDASMRRRSLPRRKQLALKIFTEDVNQVVPGVPELKVRVPELGRGTLVERARRAGWIVAGVVALVWVASRDQRVFNAGPVSFAHRSIAEDCDRCHVQSFQTSVADTGCLSCHGRLVSPDDRAPGEGRAWHDKPRDSHHPGTEASALEHPAPRCASCHVEHKGREQTQVEDRHCTRCHEDLSRPVTRVVWSQGRRIVAFSTAEHPEFAALAPVPGAPARSSARLVDAAGRDQGRIEVNHARHLAEKMSCADCHEPTPSGRLMLPVSYARHCERCHTKELTLGEGVRLPHGVETDALRRFVRGVAAVDSSSRGSSWIRDKELSLLRGCAVCHRFDDRVSPDDPVFRAGFDAGAFGRADLGREPKLPRIGEAGLPDRWFTNAVFNHEKHRVLGCVECHARAATSQKTADVLVPGRDSCVRCHAPGGARSGCTECHVYHPR